jgi:ribosomal protein L24E
MKFCLNCGLALERQYNKKYDGTIKDMCHEKCKKAHERKQRPRNRKKYGVAGYIYD